MTPRREDEGVGLTTSRPVWTHGPECRPHSTSIRSCLEVDQEQSSVVRLGSRDANTVRKAELRVGHSITLDTYEFRGAPLGRLVVLSTFMTTVPSD